MSVIDKIIALLQETPNTYAEYLKRAIVETIADVSDEKLLKYIHTMLNAAVTAETQTEDY